ncbi:C40 family peptidase [Herbidospora solisilvae]|uniref:C40 family peptidase n=1 Tax=Herbidospora solisilvae TaxID=2696284 RepID=UPI002E2B4537|nr:C40 family peptidase [Herbidospora solisilvae]
MPLRVGGFLHEARQDLAFRPRFRRPHLARRAIPVIGVALAVVLITDLLVLAGLDDVQERAALDVRRPPVVAGDYVAASGQAPSNAVAPLGKLARPHLFVVAPAALKPEQVDEVRRQKGVRAVELADAADVNLGGWRVPTMGVDPSTFRAFTPKRTATSDELWANVAAGDVVVSYELGKEGGLKLGDDVRTPGAEMRVGAYATVGMGSIHAVVSRDTATRLGLPHGNALVVSAPSVDSAKLRKKLLKVLPGSQIATINPVVIAPPRRHIAQPQRVVQWPASALMSVPQIETALRAAASKLGSRYVWGAEGPDTFDCSGLVQWAYAQAGVRMPRVTNQQWATGPQVPLSQAQPGDLLFWRNDPTNPGYISHVAIYWGNGQMLHSPRTGDVVKIAPLNTRNLAGVVRVSPQVAARVR